MKPFKLFNVATVDEAVSRFAKYDGKAKLMTGGTDLLGVLKNRILPDYPEAIINLKTIPNLDYIKEDAEGLKIGALAKLSAVADSSIVKDKYDVLAQAAKAAASPQIRNMGTIGGNLCQDVRCWYYRYPYCLGERILCLRKGGSLCYAAAGDNRYHSIFGAPRGCFAVHPSDTAPALIALNAEVVTTKRTIALEDFFDPLTGEAGLPNILEVGEILTEVQVPTPVAGTKGIYLKFRVRKAIDFAIVSVAAVLTVEGGICKDARIVLAAVAPVPYRATGAEDAIKGQAITEALAETAGAAAVKGTIPIDKNKYKVQIVKTLVKRAILACK